MTRSELQQILFEELQQEWNRAELTLKSAEQICGEPVMPSIQELRYAGRRLIEALSADDEHARKLIHDAVFNCFRAQHDAIDVATAFIVARLEESATRVGYGPMLQAYPDFAKLHARVAKVRGKIRASRARRDDREAIYEAIRTDDLSDLCAAFDDFRACGPIMEQLAGKEREEKGVLRRRARVSVWIAVAAIVIGAAVAIGATVAG